MMRPAREVEVAPQQFALTLLPARLDRYRPPASIQTAQL
ncbi:uncharacterized protein METZ01_LOCUS514458 [marine metagenome]|uniref:Uncharacterized protein n=1 Tax=marine metagenome TaxID=408172 RepID=A0A383EYF2_9ZZZZ